eukprot:Seg910.15 transcript_id=Seg910.15/GoldUCD/mRNA.D3Y31 product="Zinc metalloproteinase nas-4" protein_id=Seg910.15/GoldUCD/D3Y31
MKIFALLFIVYGFSVAEKHPTGRLAVFDQIAKINEKIKSIYETPSNSEEPELFEGDIIWTQSLKNDVNDKAFGSDQTLINSDARYNGVWSGGVIPYEFDVKFNQNGRRVVRKAVKQFNKHTCVKWIPRTTESDYVFFYHGDGCYSYIGKTGGKQKLSLKNSCLTRGIAMHEMMHCPGFYHEQARRDRDKHIKVHHSNIKRSEVRQFRKYRIWESSQLGVPYDKKSIMHYGNFAFSNNGKKTITSLSDPNEIIGQRRKFSKIDIQKLNKFYNCKGKTTTATKCIDLFKVYPKHKKYCDVPFVFASCKKTCTKCSPKNIGQNKAKR